MTRALVIGYGNPLRGDDGLGWAAAREVAARAAGRPLEVLALHQLTPDLAEPVSRADLVVFIDAAEGEAPGSPAWREVPAAADAAVTPAFTHAVTPQVLALLARELYGARPRLLLCTVGGAAFGPSEELSPPVRAALPEVVHRVLEAVDHA